ncbi:putative disulfide oxidoreductase [Exophiala viscosa]|uniref:putative disulfide oxidoreductase n=1 Tax=Exophiala viscosa TaxID=2486360 RepID=UPI0021A1E208|nr:putative disulfide oxidoreductase [Exophiala viscosa]
MWESIVVYTKLIGYIFTIAVRNVSSSIRYAIHAKTYKAVPKPLNVVVVGASFAGYHAAKVLANSLPTGYRVVIIEKNTHFQFSWVFPRFSVVPDHEHKAFIPYGPYLKSAPDGSYLFLQDSVIEVARDVVRLRSGKEIQYTYLVMATGSQGGVPSRLNAEEKSTGMDVLRGLQERIRNSKDLVVLGGGPAGVELATDAKEHYATKNVTLIHSRMQLLNGFDPKLHNVALKTLHELGVNVILGERLGNKAALGDEVSLHTGQKIPCDLLVKCIGQTGATKSIANLTPSCLTQSGHIKVKPTLQVTDPAFPTIYAVGDVAELGINRNSRAAMHQATVAAENIVNAIHEKPQAEYRYEWWQDGIELTLGLTKTVVFLRVDGRVALMHKSGKEIALGSARCWKLLGAMPYDDQQESDST